jgi:hypothetical protein
MLYDIAYGTSVAELILSVKGYLDKKYVPAGSMVVTVEKGTKTHEGQSDFSVITFYQPMVKVERSFGIS